MLSFRTHFILYPSKYGTVSPGDPVEHVAKLQELQRLQQLLQQLNDLNELQKVKAAQEAAEYNCILLVLVEWALYNIYMYHMICKNEYIIKI